MQPLEKARALKIAHVRNLVTRRKDGSDEDYGS